MSNLITTYSYTAFCNSLADAASKECSFVFSPAVRKQLKLHNAFWSGYALEAGSFFNIPLDSPDIVAYSKIFAYSGGVARQPGAHPDGISLPGGVGVGTGLIIPYNYQVNFKNLVFSEKLSLSIVIGNYTGAPIYFSVSFFAEVEIFD